jgi:Ca2+-binding EF-hand superfamily protein
MQNNQRNEDVRRYTRRSSRVSSEIQVPPTTLMGEDAQRRSSPSKTGKSGAPTRRLTSSMHASSSSGISLPVSSTSPVKSSSLHESTKRTHSNVASRRGSATNSNVSRQSLVYDESSGPKDRQKTKRPGSVSPFLKNTHRELKQQISTLQRHIKFIQELATLNDEKRIDMLFSMIDRDGGGTVDAEELAAAMRRNDELSFSDSIEKAIDMVALFDKDGNLDMDKDEFREYVAAMVKELGVSVSDFTEFLIVQLLLSEETDEEKQAGEMAREHINEEVKKRQELMVALGSEYIAEAYEMLDVEQKTQVPFITVAKALHESTKNESRAAQKALSVLLMVDKNDIRILNYEQFGKLMIAVAQATGKSYDEIADDLMFTLESQSSHFDENTTSSHGTPTETKQDYNEKVDDLTNRRLLQLFHLWDADGNGDISREELAEGLDKFQRASGINVDADAMAQALVVGFTSDEQLGHKEFAQAMILYAEQFGVEIHSLIDFMCSTSSSTANSAAPKDNKRKSKTKKKSSTPRASEQIKSEVDFWEDF